MLNLIYDMFIFENLKKDVLVFSHAKSVVNAAMIAVFADPGYALLYYFLDYSLATYVILILGIMICCSVFVLKYFGSLFFARELFVSSLYLCLIWLSYTIGGLTSSATFWLILPPFLAIIFGGGVKSGFFWGFICAISVIVLYLLEYLHIPLPPSPITNELFLRFFSISGLIIIILILAYFFERGKKDAANELQKINNNLRIAKENTEILFQEAELANNLKSEFLANISHDLRTHLNSIIGFANLIHDEKMGTENKKEFSQNIVSSSTALRQMIDDMLDLSKIESGKIEFHPEPVDLKILLNEIKTIHNIQIIEKNLRFTIKIDPMLTNIVIDRAKFRRILLHFVSNAIKFTPNDGYIEVRAFPLNNNYFRIEIADSGIGIREEDIKKLFVPFQQLDTGMAKKYEGVGLGLAWIRYIVEAQGGQVGVKSTLGKGCIFFAILRRI